MSYSKLLTSFILLGLIWAAAAYPQSSPVYVVELKASINPISKDYLVHWIQRANADNAVAIVIVLDTPGGLLTSMKDILSAMLASRVPTVVYVAPSGAWAASAGTFLTIAADVAAMAPGTTIGAAHPVGLGGESPEEQPSPAEQKDSKEQPTSSEEKKETESGKSDAMTQKITNFTAAVARGIAEQKRAKPEAADWAERAVRESVSATEKEALQIGIIDLIAADERELLQKINGHKLRDGRLITTEGAPVKEINMTWKEQLFNYLADPNLVYFLLIIGLYGLIYEFLSPGLGFGFAVGGISLLFAFLGLQVLPVNLVGLALILFGALLMVLDIFSATHGILTTGGVLSLIAGSLTLFGFDAPELRISPWNILAAVGTVTALFVFILGKGMMVHRRPVTTGREGMVGAVGKARDDLDPEGMVFVKGEYWKAQTASAEPIHAGEEVLVERLDEGKLVVRRR